MDFGKPTSILKARHFHYMSSMTGLQKTFHFLGVWAYRIQSALRLITTRTYLNINGAYRHSQRKIAITWQSRDQRKQLRRTSGERTLRSISLLWLWHCYNWLLCSQDNICQGPSYAEFTSTASSFTYYRWKDALEKQ